MRQYFIQLKRRNWVPATEKEIEKFLRNPFPNENLKISFYTIKEINKGGE